MPKHSRNAIKQKNTGRRQGARTPRKIIGIFTEGEVTEREYLQGLMRELHIPKELVVFFESKHSDPKGLVDDAISEKKKNRRASKRGEAVIDEWWVVVDTEGGRPGMSDAIQAARAHDICLVQSDPSFEFWLLMHFEFTTRLFTDASEVISKLHSYMHEYNAGNKHVEFGLFSPNLAMAMRNAYRVRENHTKIGEASPRTDVDILIYEINNMAHPSYRCVFENEVSTSDMSMHVLK